MSKFKLLGSTGLQSYAFIGALIAAQPAMAQETAGEQDPPATLTSEQEVESGENADCSVNPSAAECQAIVVTGSRIRRPNLDSPIPVTSVGGEEFFETGTVSVGDVLNELPALRSTFSQANSTRFLGTAGLNLLDLRGLGTVRTLVLQNGRRHVGGDVLSSGVTPDVNTIPTDLIERVDVVTGGNSAIYGSDAIAGVVNFILKDDYEGIQLRGQGGVSRYEDAGSYFVSALAGTNFADDRGNVAVNAEYARQEQYFGSARPWLNRQDAFVVVDTDPASALNGSDGVADRLFFQDIRSATLTNTGMLRFGGQNAQTGANSPLNCGLSTSGVAYNCPYLFNPTTGRLEPITGTRIGIGPNGNFIGGNGESFRGGRQFQLSPSLDRYNVNLLAHYEVSPALVPFVEAKYSRTDSSGSGSSGPAFITGSTLGDSRERIRLDNPYLNPADSAFIRAQILASGVNNNNFRNLTAAELAQLNNPANFAYRFAIRENMLGLGVRNEKAKRETFRIVGGLKGTFNDDWTYEVSGNYGRLKEKTQVLGNLNVQRFVLAADAGFDPATGTIRCRSQFVPGADIGYIDEGEIFANDVAQCIPINLLGGNFTQAQRDYLLADTTSKGETKQLDFMAFMSGDTSEFLNLPGGPIGFALGLEYRQDDLFYDQDDLVSDGYTFYNAIPTFEAPKSKVKEAFGEIRLPILKDLPFAEELTVSAAARVSDYNLGNTGTVWAYNAGAEWSPGWGLRLRGNYSRSVRAPNQVELFSLPGQNFAPGFADPCSARNIGTGSANRAANCAAAGIPTTYDFVYSQSLELVSGGNTELEAEKADSYTIGGVFTPTFLPGFSISADYYDITVKDVITAPSAQAIVNACYDASDLNNQFCDLFERVPAGGTGPVDEQEFRIVEGSLFQGPLNYAKLTTRGLDIEAAYRGQISGVGGIDTRFTYTHVFERSNFLDPTDPGRENRILSELGDPQDAFNWSTDLKTGRFTVGYQMRYIGDMYLNTYEDFNDLQDRNPENADYADRKKYPSVFYHDIRTAVDVGQDYNFYLGIDNFTNRKPPFGLTGIGAGSSIYDVRGRFYYAGFVAKF